MQRTIWVILAGMCVMGCREQRADMQQLLSGPGVVEADVSLPAVPREFRAAWVATVANIDWPSEPGLSSAAQQAELRAIFDEAAALNLNAVVFQVRCAADALYASELEPWSAYLSGTQGMPPEPAYDPLALAIAEAHARGIELHAWFNPFRAQHPANTSVADGHVTQMRPEWVRQYGDYLWLDPGEPEARDFVLAVFRDVLRRYDIDGLHVDDYFYPYPIRDGDGNLVDFPDEGPWQRYQASGGTLGRADWRLDNINRFMQALYELARAEKPEVRVGISPFGIWRPGHPAQIEGFDAYDGLYADARLWLQEGWLDYLTPQLYWRIEPAPQSYPVLLRWWVEQNTKGRHLWPGNFAARVGDRESNWPATEIVNQVYLTRVEPGAGGNVHFSMKTLVRNQGGLADLLQQAYAVPALVPATPWLDDAPPEPPTVQAVAADDSGAVRLQISPPAEQVRAWVVQSRYGRRWDLRIVAGGAGAVDLPATLGGEAVDLVAVRAVDGCGNLSVAAVVR